MLFSSNSQINTTMPQMEISALLTSLLSFGVQWNESDLLQSNLRLADHIHLRVKPQISELKIQELESQLEALRKGNSSILDFQRTLYFARDPSEGITIPLASPRSEVSSKSDGRKNRYNLNLAYILQQMPLNLLNETFGYGSIAWLPGMLKIAEIKAFESQSPNRQFEKVEPGRYVSVVLWTGEDADFSSAIARIDTKLPRLVITGKVDGDRIDVAIVESLIFDNVLNTWEPNLYEAREIHDQTEISNGNGNGNKTTNKKILQRVFETEDGNHSIQKCVRCHGVKNEFSPIPFKFRKTYEPSPGWFNMKVANQKPVGGTFGFWSIQGARNHYNSIKETRVTWESSLPVEKDQREIEKRISNSESVRVYYSMNNEVFAKTEWALAFRRDIFETNTFKFFEKEELHREALRLKAEIEASSRAKSVSKVEFGTFVLYLDDNNFMSFPYVQKDSEDFSSVRDALAKIEAAAQKSRIQRIFRLHSKGLNKRRQQLILTPIEMKFELEVAARLQKFKSSYSSFNWNSSVYSFFLLSQNTEGKFFATNYRQLEF